MKTVINYALILLGISTACFSYGKPKIKNDFDYFRKLKVDFDTSMEFAQGESHSQKRNSPVVNTCRKIYKTNNFEKVELRKKEIIPKIVHLIWVGPLNPPAIFTRCKESIALHLKDWECKIWTDKDIQGLNLYNQQFYDEETCYGAKADILRYELLERFGGLYLDIDFVLLRPLDFLHHTYEFYASMMPSNAPDTIANGVIGCIPGHPIIRECVLNIKNHRHHDHLLKRTGPLYFEKIFYACMNDKDIESEKVIIFPKSFWIPLDYQHRALTEKEVLNKIKPETLAIHFWANSWGASMPPTIKPVQ